MPVMATCQEKITNINKLLLMHFKTMYKVLPCIVQLRRYSRVKKKRCFFSISFCTTKFLGCHFCNQVKKSIESEAELRTDQDGA